MHWRWCHWVFWFAWPRYVIQCNGKWWEAINMGVCFKVKFNWKHFVAAWKLLSSYSTWGGFEVNPHKEMNYTLEILTSCALILTRLCLPNKNVLCLINILLMMTMFKVNLISKTMFLYIFQREGQASFLCGHLWVPESTWGWGSPFCFSRGLWGSPEAGRRGRGGLKEEAEVLLHEPLWQISR